MSDDEFPDAPAMAATGKEPFDTTRLSIDRRDLNFSFEHGRVEAFLRWVAPERLNANMKTVMQVGGVAELTFAGLHQACMLGNWRIEAWKPTGKYALHTRADLLLPSLLSRFEKSILFREYEKRYRKLPYKAGQAVGKSTRQDNPLFALVSFRKGIPSGLTLHNGHVSGAMQGAGLFQFRTELGTLTLESFKVFLSRYWGVSHGG